jgi:hypothetical protein
MANIKKVYETKLTSIHAAQGLKHKLRKLCLKHFTQSPVTSLTAYAENNHYPSETVHKKQKKKKKLYWKPA